MRGHNGFPLLIQIHNFDAFRFGEYEILSIAVLLPSDKSDYFYCVMEQEVRAFTFQIYRRYNTSHNPGPRNHCLVNIVLRLLHGF